MIILKIYALIYIGFGILFNFASMLLSNDKSKRIDSLIGLLLLVPILIYLILK